MLLLLPCVIQKSFPFCTGSGRVPPILSGSNPPDKSAGERPLSHRNYTGAIADPRCNDIQRNAQTPQKYPFSALLSSPFVYTFPFFFPVFPAMLLLSFFTLFTNKKSDCKTRPAHFFAVCIATGLTLISKFPMLCVPASQRVCQLFSLSHFGFLRNASQCFVRSESNRLSEKVDYLANSDIYLQ